MPHMTDADPNDASTLSEIAFCSKSFWKYPQEYMDQWKGELTITKDYIEKHIVRCVAVDDRLVGFYSLVFLENPMEFGNITMEQGYWLDHMFILPEYHKRGLGRACFSDIDSKMAAKEIESRLLIFVDPHAVGFYKKLGCRQVRMSQSSIPNRKIPVLEYRFHGEGKDV